MCEQTWVDAELGTADFGDVRLNRRCVVIVAQGTTELDFSGTRAVSHLGSLSYAARVGWLMHLSLALTLDRRHTL